MAVSASASGMRFKQKQQGNSNATLSNQKQKPKPNQKSKLKQKQKGNPMPGSMNSSRYLISLSMAVNAFLLTSLVYEKTYHPHPRLIGEDSLVNKICLYDNKEQKQEQRQRQMQRQIATCSLHLQQLSQPFAWLKCEGIGDEEDCAKLLRSHGIITRSGRHFGAPQNYVRLSILDRNHTFNLLIDRLSAIL